MTTHEDTMYNYKMYQIKYYSMKLKIPTNILRKENNISKILILFKEQLMEYDIEIDALYLLKLLDNEILDISIN